MARRRSNQNTNVFPPSAGATSGNLPRRNARNRRNRNRGRQTNAQRLQGVGVPTARNSGVMTTPRQLGGGADFQMIDRETIRVSHAYMSFRVTQNNLSGSFTIRPSEQDPEFASMLTPYTKFRIRGMSIMWQPAVSVVTNGLIAFEVSVASRTLTDPTLEQIASAPGSSLGTIFDAATCTLDARGFGSTWWPNIGSSAGGYPTFMWKVELEPSNITYGYFVVSYMAEYSAPIYAVTPQPPSSDVLQEKIRELTTKVELLESNAHLVSAARATNIVKGGFGKK
jgi:hypothetical protein